jgi:hypothetical protein
MTVWRSDPSVPAVLAVLSLPFFPVLQIQTILILIRIRLSNLIPIRILTYKVLSCILQVHYWYWCWRRISKPSGSYFRGVPWSCRCMVPVPRRYTVAVLAKELLFPRRNCCSRVRLLFPREVAVPTWGCCSRARCSFSCTRCSFSCTR